MNGFAETKNVFVVPLQVLPQNIAKNCTHIRIIKLAKAMNSLEKDEMGTAHRSGQIGSLRCGGPYSNADEGNPGEP